MNAPQGDSLEQLECDVLAEHSGARVVIRRSIRKVFDALNDRAQGRLKQVMVRWCSNPGQLTQEMFNGNEGRSPRHNEMLQAFKNNSAKLRLYGFSFTLSNMRTFIIVDADTAKKQDRADPKLLKRAKSRVDEMLDRL